MIKIRFLLLLFILGCTIHIYAQEADSLAFRPSPRGAMFRSAVLPGWGQLYNRKIWKSLFVVGGGAALAGNAVYYNQLAMENAMEGDREFYGKIRNQFVWYAVFFYILNIMDAYIDAHLYDFDTGPDLSFQRNQGIPMTPLLTMRFQF